MKCTSCGNTNLFKTRFPLESYGDGGASLSKKVDVYLCLECGHFEFYSMEKVTSYNDTVSIIKEMEHKIDALRQEMEHFKEPEIAQQLKEEIKAIEIQYNSLDITIRQQQELKAKHSELKKQLISIPREIERRKYSIEQLESSLRTIKYNFECDSSLDDFSLMRARELLQRT